MFDTILTLVFVYIVICVIFNAFSRGGSGCLNWFLLGWLFSRRNNNRRPPRPPMGGGFGGPRTPPRAPRPPMGGGFGGGSSRGGGGGRSF